MKQDIQRIMLAAARSLFLIFILYLLKTIEVGMDWNFSHLGVYPMEKRGIIGILTHPLIHSGFSHLFANTLPLFFLSWCYLLRCRRNCLGYRGENKEWHDRDG